MFFSPLHVKKWLARETIYQTHVAEVYFASYLEFSLTIVLPLLFYSKRASHACALTHISYHNSAVWWENLSKNMTKTWLNTLTAVQKSVVDLQLLKTPYQFSMKKLAKYSTAVLQAR